MKKLLALILVALLCLAMAAPALAADEVGAVVTARALNLRSGAGTNHSILGSYPRGTLVSVESITGSWAKVALLGANGEHIEGWMYTGYLALTNVDLGDEAVATDGVESRVLPQGEADMIVAKTEKEAQKEDLEKTKKGNAEKKPKPILER
ncbi:MAG: SH3 domain-containing protein [Christensenellaceae bacterium]|jgi:uncharacterized protein YgiM (DUF1202 family)|nr:SH3 domain-containing protein [Christensenellaceae bacterium]